MAARPGFEPGSEDPKSFVLPLHHRATTCGLREGLRLRARSGGKVAGVRAFFDGAVRLELLDHTEEIDRPTHAEHHRREDAVVILVPQPFSQSVDRRDAEIVRHAEESAYRLARTNGVDECPYRKGDE